MSLLENTLFGIRDKVQTAIDRIKSFEPPEGYFVAYSGGKDSEVVLDLVKRSGVKYDAHFAVTSVEMPETIYYIRREHPEVIWNFPKYADGKIKTMWNLIPKKKIPPTRLVRYCCAELKECAGDGRVTITGVRWAESTQRKNNRHLVDISGKTGTKSGTIIYNNDNDEAKRMVEHCYRTRKTLVNPIIDWTDDDVWEYIKTRKLKYNPLYDKGFKRVGCIGCPMNTRSAEELEMFPQIKRLYLKAFREMLDAYKTPPKEWKTPEDVYIWWTKWKDRPNEMQTTLFTEEDGYV